MTDFLLSAYPWFKALHILSMIAWMAGLFYLPRLFVYHAEQAQGMPDTAALFEIMEVRLLRYIMNPAMIGTWTFGLALALSPGVVDWSLIWPWTKTLAVLLLTWFHHWLGLRRKDFLRGENKVSGKTYRLMNEVPTFCMIVIVFSVIFKL